MVAQIMSMTGEEILQLLEEFKLGSDNQNAKHFLSQHQQLCDVVCELIQDNYVDEDIMDGVCRELLNFYYRGGGWKCFSIQFIPVIIGTYLSAISQGHRKYCAHFETFLLAVYNNEVTKQNPTEKIEQVRLPSLSNPSVYHRDPAVLLSGTMLTESAVSRLYGKEIAYIEIGPYPTCASFNAENKFLVLTWLVKLYNSYLNYVNPSTVTLFCKLCTRLCRSGFHYPESDLVQKVITSESGKDRFRHVADYADLPRVNLHSSFILELLDGVYFAMFSSNSTLQAVQALDDIHQRACYELFADVLLVTNAIANSLIENPSGSPVDGPMGIHAIVAHPIGSGDSTRRKLVTNASLRIKKLPDDIPLKTASVDGSASTSSSAATSSPSNEPSFESLSHKPAHPTNVPAPIKPNQLLFIDSGKTLGGLKESRSEVCMKDLQKRAQYDSSDYRRRPTADNDEPNEETAFMDDVEEEVNIEDGFCLKTPPVYRLNITVQANGGNKTDEGKETRF